MRKKARTPSRLEHLRPLRVTLVMVLAFAVAAAAWCQTPPPRPDPPPDRTTQQEGGPPVDRPPLPDNSGPPPPVLLVSSDMGCRLELDGEPIGELEKDVATEFVVRPGDHLLQAFPLTVEGPAWKKAVKAPDTGQFVVTIELVKLVEDYEESQRDKDRFETVDAVVMDHETGLMWARNVGPEMSWEQARSFCAGRNLAQATGWRLPVLDELSTLQYEDHESPRQEMLEGKKKWTILGPRRGDSQVLPRLIQPAFDHNSVAALWIGGDPERTACGFLGGFSCEVQRKKKNRATALCVRTFSDDDPVVSSISPGGFAISRPTGADAGTEELSGVR